MCHVAVYVPLLYLFKEHGRLNSGIFFFIFLIRGWASSTRLFLLLSLQLKQNSNFGTSTTLLGFSSSSDWKATLKKQKIWTSNLEFIHVSIHLVQDLYNLGFFEPLQLTRAWYFILLWYMFRSHYFKFLFNMECFFVFLYIWLRIR